MHPEGDSISLLQIGYIDPDLFATIHAGLQSFLRSVSGTGKGAGVRTGYLTEPYFPVGRFTGWQGAYSSLLSGHDHGPVTIGITAQGFWETVPKPRFIFCSVVGPGTAALSLYRFERMRANRMARIQKEAIKGLGMALGIGHCSDPSCIQSYHWNDEDFDRNTGVCESCVRTLQEQLRQCFDETAGRVDDPCRQTSGVVR
jgi:hypothetical protein